jgi:outer membrane protein OmpA-like peptidoglycan-associated protein
LKKRFTAIISAVVLNTFILNDVSAALKRSTPTPKGPTDSISLTPTVGGYFFAGSDHYKHTPLYGLKFSYDFNAKSIADSLGLEATVNYFDTQSTAGKGSVTGLLFRTDAIYPFTPGKKIIPFLALGAGGISLQSAEASSSRLNPLLNYGGGIKYFFEDYLALRADLRHIIVYENLNTRNNFEIALGLTYVFGKERKKKPAPPKPKEPEILCTGVPPGVPVDKNGCPFDGDRDGVPDYLDKCPDTPLGIPVDKDGCPVPSEMKKEVPAKVAPGPAPGAPAPAEKAAPPAAVPVIPILPIPVIPLPGQPAPAKPAQKEEKAPVAAQKAPAAPIEKKPEAAAAPEKKAAAPAERGILPAPAPAAKETPAAPAARGPVPAPAAKETPAAPAAKGPVPAPAAKETPAAPAAKGPVPAPVAEEMPAAPAAKGPVPAPTDNETPAAPAANSAKAIAPPAPPEKEKEKYTKVVGIEGTVAVGGAAKGGAPGREILLTPGKMVVVRKGEEPPAPVTAPPAEMQRAKEAASVVTIEFPANSSYVQPKYFEQIREIVATLKTFPGSYAMIEGHSDSIGQKEKNVSLSRQRAESVKKTLESFGAEPSKISIAASGSSKPVADNATPAARQKNRRSVVTTFVVRIVPGPAPAAPAPVEKASRPAHEKASRPVQPEPIAGGKAGGAETAAVEATPAKGEAEPSTPPSTAKAPVRLAVPQEGEPAPLEGAAEEKESDKYTKIIGLEGKIAAGTAAPTAGPAKAREAASVGRLQPKPPPSVAGTPGSKASIEFDPGSSYVKPKYARELKKLAEAAALSPGSKVVVEGRPDSAGKGAKDLGLSQKRAESVKEILAGLGADPSGIETKVYCPDKQAGGAKGRGAVTTASIVPIPAAAASAPAAVPAKEASTPVAAPSGARSVRPPAPGAVPSSEAVSVLKPSTQGTAPVPEIGRQETGKKRRYTKIISLEGRVGVESTAPAKGGEAALVPGTKTLVREGEAPSNPAPALPDELRQARESAVINQWDEAKTAAAAGKPVARKVGSVTIEFRSNRADVAPKYRKQLEKLAALIGSSPGSRAKIDGHTDSSGNRSFNFWLSRKRAESVKNSLVNFGVDPGRISTVGYGPTKPIADNATPEGRRKNRRASTKVTVLIYPAGYVEPQVEK